MTERTPAASPEALAAGYARCAEITREHGTTYYWGARLLPAESRRHVHAVYTLARLADDIVDLAGPDPGPETAAALDAFERCFWDALASGSSPDPVMAAVVTTVRECGIDEECFSRFFGAMRTDLTRRTYETWGDLLGYMDGSAAVIGEMMLPVLRPGTDAVAPARALGLAFQLTNFLRDVGEDLDRGRVYVPQEDLRRFGADPHARVVTPEWRALMAFEIERNRRLYREADDGIPALPGASRRCVATARVLYARILERIEAADYDVFATRARVPTVRKAALAARMVTSREPMRVVRSRPGRRRPARQHLGVGRPRRAARRAGGADRPGVQVGRPPRRHAPAPRVLLLRPRPRRAAPRDDARTEQAQLPGCRHEHGVRPPEAR